MLKVDNSLNHIPAQREHVIALYESINQPLVNIPGAGAASTGAYVLGTRNGQGSHSVFVYLFQAETRTVVVYVSEPRELQHEAFRAEIEGALGFVESMGFMTDNLHFPTLAPAEQDTVMARVPLFRPPEQTIDLLEVAEEVGPSPFDPSAPMPTVGPSSGLFGGMSEEDSRMFQRVAPRPQAERSQPSTAPAPAASLPPGFHLAEEAGLSSSRPHRDPASLARLGRMLGAFGWLLAITLSACASQQTTAKQKQEIDSLADLGAQHLMRRQWPDAVKAYGQVLDIDDKNRDALRGTGYAYVQIGRLDSAEEYYNKAIAADPKWSVPKNELATLKIRRGECAAAVPLLQEVMKDIFYTTPQFAAHNLALAEHCLGEKAQAVDRLDKLMLRYPRFCLGYLTLSGYAEELGRNDLVVQSCQGFEQKCAEDAQIREQVLPEQRALCYLRSGRANIQLGDVESARAAFERCGQEGRIGRECQQSLRLLPP